MENMLEGMLDVLKIGTDEKVKDIIKQALILVERVITNQDERAYNELKDVLDVYQVTISKFFECINQVVKDKHKYEFDQLELEQWHQLYKNIQECDISETKKLDLNLDSMYILNKSNNNKRICDLLKFGIGAITLTKLTAMIGMTLDSLKDDQKTRRIRYRGINNKK